MFTGGWIVKIQSVQSPFHSLIPRLRTHLPVKRRGPRILGNACSYALNAAIATNILVKFMQMLRARSPLFFAQKKAEGKALKTWAIKEVHADGKTLTLDSMEPKPPSDAYIKNWTIRQMQEEIKKGASWLWNFDWALRFTDSVENPFVFTEAPFLVNGVRAGEMAKMLRDPETLIYFPICWQACLFGSSSPFDKKTDKFGPQDMQVFRKKYRTFAQTLLVSPTKLEDITQPILSGDQGVKAATA